MHRALVSSNDALIAKYSKMDKAPDSAETLRNVDKALKDQITAIVRAADAYDAAFDVGALSQLNTLEKAFAKMVKKANDDSFSLEDLNVLFAEVKAIYEQAEKTVEAAKGAKDAAYTLTAEEPAS